MLKQKPEDLLEEKLEITDRIQAILAQTAKWARFLSVTGFIMTGLMLLFALLLPLYFNPSRFGGVGELSGQSFSVMGMRINITIIAGLLLFPCLFLFRFARNMNEALQTDSQDALEGAFSHLKSTFKFYGILVIITLALYLLALVVVIINALAGI